MKFPTQVREIPGNEYLSRARRYVRSGTRSARCHNEKMVLNPSGELRSITQLRQAAFGRELPLINLAFPPIKYDFDHGVHRSIQQCESSRNLNGGKMLSIRTVAFLEELADSSHLAYPEGGLLFRYQYAHKQAHRLLNASMQDALYVEGLTEYSEITGRILNDLARFFSGALGDYTEGSAADLAVLSASRLIDHLKEDLRYDLVELVVEDGNYDMTATFEMASKSQNNYSRLELFWSVD